MALDLRPQGRRDDTGDGRAGHPRHRPCSGVGGGVVLGARVPPRDRGTPGRSRGPEWARGEWGLPTPDPEGRAKKKLYLPQKYSRAKKDLLYYPGAGPRAPPPDPQSRDVEGRDRRSPGVTAAGGGGVDSPGALSGPAVTAREGGCPFPKPLRRCAGAGAGKGRSRTPRRLTRASTPASGAGVGARRGGRRRKPSSLGAASAPPWPSGTDCDRPCPAG